MISFADQFGDLEDCVHKHEYPNSITALNGVVLWTLAVRHNPLAAMCNYRNTHSTERLPAKPEAKPAPHGIMAVTVADWRLGAWK
jgi:hypothetical protein